MRISHLLLCCALASLLAGCGVNGFNDVSADDVGQSIPVKFGTVDASRPVTVHEHQSGVGTFAGAMLGAVAGSFIGSGVGNEVATLGGAAAGGVGGAVVDHEMSLTKGVEYTITYADGTTGTVTERLAKGDPIYGPGEPVMVQFGGTWNKVISTRGLPNQVAVKRVTVAHPISDRLGQSACRWIDKGDGSPRSWVCQDN